MAVSKLDILVAEHKENRTCISDAGDLSEECKGCLDCPFILDETEELWDSYSDSEEDDESLFDFEISEE
jgi:hypothetical protein